MFYQVSITTFNLLPMAQHSLPWHHEPFISLHCSLSFLVSLLILLLPLLMISPEHPGSCIKIGLKCTRLVNKCLQIYQSAYNILCISALFIVAEYYWLLCKDISSPICNLNIKFFCQRLYLFYLQTTKGK